ncbi:hypothetical protein K6U06_16690 [Acidiferrimicrobium sp. IK]|uniref:hypothetical protein n=1 Tax=Acidiferrimicrobium sp. IK TaxID=2871700 RepID=UPI0021CB9894|nr:hypothetical protein [Acidiferrimicrobium sp. IK]MCU4186009.1 hypothetical protein [Acidiferrimicrobium sp. IK]
MTRPAAAAVAATAADTARRVPGVVDLDSGPLGTKVTYGSNGRVPGITVRNSDGARRVTLHLKLAWGPVTPIAKSAIDAVLDALQSEYPDAGPWQVDVEVLDMADPDAVEAPSPRDVVA